MKHKTVFPVLFALTVVLLSACTAIRQISFSCPTDDVFKYLNCVDPLVFAEYPEEERESNLQGWAKFIELYCTDDASEWIPVMESRVRESLPDIRRYMESQNINKIEGVELRNLGNRELYRGVITKYLGGPIIFGASIYKGNTYHKSSSCAALFELLQPGHFNPPLGRLEDE